MSKTKLYLAGGLFNAGTRLHNLYLEKHLNDLGYETILPQREAVPFLAEEKDGEFCLEAIAQDCHQAARTADNLYVGCIDGADADSGASAEYGIAIESTGRAIVYRTDFRTAKDKELGFNAMFRIKGTSYVYVPSSFTELEEVDAYYEKLAVAIHAAVVLTLGRDPTISP